MRDALSRPGCALCGLNAAAVDHFLETLLWESVTDPGVRDGVRRARGFCSRHERQLARPSASLGVAILHHDVLRAILRELVGARFESLPRLSARRAREALDRGRPTAATAGLVSRLEPQEPCPACRHEDTMEALYLDALLEGLAGEGGLEAAYQASDGLCLPHFRQALARVRDEATFAALVAAHVAVWRRLEADLAEFIRKSDHRFRDEPWGSERDAWLRAVDALAGPQPTP